ncbi:MAG: hypothetical protein ACOYUZ_02075 [Patescibacteria group bacterium]
MKPPLIFDDSNLRGNLFATQRINPHEIFDARQNLIQLHKRGEQGWLSVVDDKDHIDLIKAQVKVFKKYKNCLVIGIGGSDLGTRAAIHALADKYVGSKIWFTGNTTDPDAISKVFDTIPWKQTCINVISKSGGTLECMSVFLEAKERLEKAVGAKKAAKAIICTTDPESGELRDFAVQNGYATLSVPQNIGGRFSVLTSVGLFPMAMANIKIDALLKSAAKIRDDWFDAFGTSHDIDRFAAWHVAHGRNGRPIHVLFCYSEALREFAMWYRQIWAESLGKLKAHGGPTPVAAIGPADQHSQLQLYQDGPDDKVYTFLNVKNFASKLRIPKSIAKFDDLKYAKNHSFADLIHAAQKATAAALLEQERPVGTLEIDKVSEESLGALFMFYEIATAMAGFLYCINPFDQPGVEASKSNVKQILSTK